MIKVYQKNDKYYLGTQMMTLPEYELIKGHISRTITVTQP